MTDNPMGNMFGEGFDINALMQQAQAMQEQLASAQEELASAEVEGTAGGLVTVTVTGAGELTKVQIATGSFDPEDADSLEDLGDLVVAAYRDAKTHADAMAQEKMGPLTSGLGGALGGPDAGGPGGLPGGGSGIGF